MATPEQCAEASRRARQLRDEEALLAEGRRLQAEAVRQGDFLRSDQLGRINEQHEEQIRRTREELRRFLEDIGL